MIQAHAFDAWLAPAAKAGPGYEVIRHLSGLPSRMFLLLVGVSAAIRFEGQIAKGVPTTAIRRAVAQRGLLILALAYLFRLQEYLLAGMTGGVHQLFRVDILNAIGASLLVIALVAVPRAGRRQILAALAAAAVCIGLGPLVGPAHFPAWLPRPLTSYLGGQRPMAWFPLFPWGAWPLVGVALGHLWVRASHDPRRRHRVFLLGGVIGAALTGTVSLVRACAPDLIHYPSQLVQQMGPGSFFHRLGVIGALAAAGHLVSTATGERFSPLRQLGRTSLLIYWIHVDLCYGHAATFIRGRLGIARALAWLLVLVGAMLVVSLLKTRYARTVAAFLGGRLRALAGMAGSR